MSFLTMLDGGTALAEKGRIYLVDEEGDRLGEGLLDEFVSQLIETDRLAETSANKRVIRKRGHSTFCKKKNVPFFPESRCLGMTELSKQGLNGR